MLFAHDSPGPTAPAPVTPTVLDARQSTGDSLTYSWDVNGDGVFGDVPVSTWNLPAPAAPSFREDILPLLTRAGCNQGACHGKLAGQNGFRLSLRGFAPDEDFDHLTREGRGRRLNFAQPDARKSALCYAKQLYMHPLPSPSVA